MQDRLFLVLVASMILNFAVLGISINRARSFFPVALSALSISLQGYALRLIALTTLA